jgi:lipoprotein signal peptidase
MMIGYALAILIGLFWYFRFTKQYFYLYRWPLAIIVGTGIGAALRTVIFAQFTTQIIAQAKLNLWVAGDLMKSFNNIMIFIMVPCVVLYFWFTGSYRDSTPMKVIDKVARYTMMAGFGAGFGYTILTRYSMFIGRAQYLLGITPNPPEAVPAFIVIAFIMLATMIGYDLMQRNKKQ